MSRRMFLTILLSISIAALSLFSKWVFKNNLDSEIISSLLNSLITSLTPTLFSEISDNILFIFHPKNG